VGLLGSCSTPRCQIAAFLTPLTILVEDALLGQLSSCPVNSLDCSENPGVPVNLHISKQLLQAAIRGFQPFKGFLTIQLKGTCSVRVCIPDFVEPSTVMVDVNGARVQAKVFGNYPFASPHDRGSRDRQSRLSALSLSCDVEGRYGGAYGAAAQRIRDWLF